MAFKDRINVGMVPLYEWVGVAEVTTPAIHNARSISTSSAELMRHPGELHLALFRATDGGRDLSDIGRFFCDVKAVLAFEAPFHEENDQVCATCRAYHEKRKR